MFGKKYVAILFKTHRINWMANALSLALLLSLCVSCSSIPKNSKGDAEIFSAPDGKKNHFQVMAPVFLVHEPDKPFNRIGTPRVRAVKKGGPEIYVDSIQGTLFTAEYQFSTASNTYTNLVYRLHFEKIPFEFGNFHLSAGKNPGLFVVLTHNSNNDLLLITTVHTCGCYLAFFPTYSLPPDAFPKNWPNENQWVFGKKLPAIVKAPKGNEKILITLDSGSHRVSIVEIENAETLGENYTVNTLGIRPMDTLWDLPFENKKVPFYETHGLRKGYVKNNSKPLERILMSWWALDWYIGQDKVLGDHEETGTTFYTSLKFWRRKDSDMWDFARFLQYWGWHL